MNEGIESSQTVMSSYVAERWNDAREMCRKNLNQHDLNYLDEIESCDDFRQSLVQLHHAFHHMSTHTLLNRLNPSLESLKNFMTLLAVAMGSTPMRTAIVWGILSLAVQAAGSMTTILSETIEMLGTLGHDIEILQIYEDSFINNAQMGRELVDIFLEIISFWTKAIHFLRRNKYELAALPYWPQVRRDFEESSKRIRKRTLQIKEKADAIASAARRPAVLLQAMDGFGSTTATNNPYTPATSEAPSIFPCHNISLPRNSHFMGRYEELSSITSHLFQDHFCHQMKSFALWGTGGIGKTQIALAYAYRQSDEGIDTILWVNCETGLSIARSFSDIAAMLQIEGYLTSENPDQNRFLVLKWLRNTSMSWLMVLDNVENNELARDCWPVASHGAILVTSRRSIVAIDPAAGGIEIKEFDVAEGSDILLHLVNRPPYDEDEVMAAKDLSNELGGLGLALGIMAAQIRLKKKSIRNFLDFYRRHSLQLHRETRGLGSYYKGSLHSCWLTTFDNLDSNSSVILGIMSFLAPDMIPEQLFQPKASTTLPKLLKFCEDDLEFENAVDGLLETSLIKREPFTKGLSIHRLIQFEFHTRMDLAIREKYFRVIAELIYERFPKQLCGETMRNDWDRCQTYVQHVLVLCACWQTYKFRPADDPEYNVAFTKLLSNCAWYLLETGAWSEELELMKTALEVCEDKSLEYAHLCNTFACVETERSNAKHSLELLEPCISIRKELLGERHEELAHSLSNYGNATLQAYATPDAVERALYYTKKAHAIDDMQPENERIKIAYIRYVNLSRTYRYLGKYDEAMKFALLARENVKTVFPPGSHFEATVDVHQANIIFDLGDVATAEAMWQRAFETFNKLNEVHAATISVQMKLACLKMKKGLEELDEAIATFKKLLVTCKLREKAKGDKGEIARVTRRFAEAMRLKGDYVEAERLRQEAESMRHEIQKSRTWKLPDEERSYDVLVYNEFW